jgi:hypothetical protein
MVRREDVARSVADAVLAVPGVADLSPGPGVEVATLFSGGKVVGVRLTGEQVEIHIRADQAPLPPVAEAAAQAARRVLAASGDDRPIQIFVDDITAEAFGRRGTE